MCTYTCGEEGIPRRVQSSQVYRRETSSICLHCRPTAAVATPLNNVFFNFFYLLKISFIFSVFFLLSSHFSWSGSFPIVGGVGNHLKVLDHQVLREVRVRALHMWCVLGLPLIKPVATTDSLTCLLCIVPHRNNLSCVLFLFLLAFLGGNLPCRACVVYARVSGVRRWPQSMIICSPPSPPHFSTFFTF